MHSSQKRTHYSSYKSTIFLSLCKMFRGFYVIKEEQNDSNERLGESGGDETIVLYGKSHRWEIHLYYPLVA